eukprot:4708482-Alexandrium_andersonii.AAC.1
MQRFTGLQRPFPADPSKKRLRRAPEAVFGGGGGRSGGSSPSTRLRRLQCLLASHLSVIVGWWPRIGARVLRPCQSPFSLGPTSEIHFGQSLRGGRFGLA